MQIALYAGLTEMQRALVSALLSGMPLDAAGELAGYRGNGVHNALAANSVRRALREGMFRQMALDAPMAWKLVSDTARDEKADAKLRIMCAKDILDRTGFVPPKAAEASAERALEDMTRDELVAFINQANDRKASMATPVNTSDSAAVEAQLAGMLE